MWQQLWRDERGATAIEYALVASLISIVRRWARRCNRCSASSNA